MRFMHPPFALLIAAAPATFLGLAGCSRQPNPVSEQAATSPSSEIPAVKVVHPERKSVRRLIQRPGFNLEAYERTPLYAKIAGYVSKWNFDMGDRAHKNDVLAEIYIPELEAELKQKDAAVEQAAAEIQQAMAAKQRAEAEQERAKGQYARLAMVGRSGLLDKEQVDESRLGSKSADAALLKAQADVSVAEARLKVAKADRDHVETLLQYTKIRAPYDGRVTRRFVHTGDFVQPAGNGKGEALFIMEMIDPVRVVVNVQELEAVWVNQGDLAVIRPQSLPGQQVIGKVTRTSGAVDPQSRTLRTEIDLPNADGKLQTGMYVKATIIAEHKNVWTLPAKAIVAKGEQSSCYRVENGKVVLTPIHLGLQSNEAENDVVEVLKKGTKPKVGGETKWEDFTGAEAIASNASSLADGQAVRLAAAKE